jgi:hypothetical protein
MKHGTAVAVALAGALAASSSTAQQGGDKVAFPTDLGTLYGTVDRPDNKQFRELYVRPAEAIEAAKQDKPLPSGTVLTMVQYAAALDGEKNPVKGPDGRFVKTKVVAYTVMEKRTGWGTQYADDIRNGEWEYQAFTADRTPNPKANLVNCFKCHKPLDARQDFVFSYDRLKNPIK